VLAGGRLKLDDGAKPLAADDCGYLPLEPDAVHLTGTQLPAHSAPSAASAGSGPASALTCGPGASKRFRGGETLAAAALPKRELAHPRGQKARDGVRPISCISRLRVVRRTGEPSRSPVKTHRYTRNPIPRAATRS